MNAPVVAVVVPRGSTAVNLSVNVPEVALVEPVAVTCSEYVPAGSKETR